jgi:phosphoglycerol transferase MdoB-like AlkP superfamily enzyme
LKKKFFKLIDRVLKFDYRNYCKNNVLFLTFIITSVINGFLLRFLTVKNALDLRPVVADCAMVILVGAFGYLIKPKKRIIYYFIWSIIYSAICVINSMYYTNYLSFSSISLIATSFLIVDVGDAIVENVMEIKDFCYLWQLFVILIVHFKLHKSNYYSRINYLKSNFYKTLLLGFSFIVIFALTLTSTDIGRITKQWNREYIVMRYGIYTYQFSDIFASLTPKLNSMFGYDSNSKLFRDYYDSNSSISSENEFSNIFEGKNVLVIHAESVQKFTLDTSINGVSLTPNLNKLASEGIYFDNFYAEESVGTSSDSEFTFSTSLMPATSGTVAINYWDREYPTIQKEFKKKGYYVFSMHGNNCSFWNRNLLHQSFGYDKFYCYTDSYNIDETIGLGLSDKSFFKQSISYLKDINKNNSNWYGTMIMLTNHTPFSYISDYSDLDVTYKSTVVDKETGKSTVKTFPYLEGTVLGNYFKSVHYADQAIGQLLSDMDKEGLLDNTVVVIYGDHDAKIKKSEYDFYYNYDFKTNSVLSSDDPNYHEVTDYEYEINRKVPFIIWTKDSKFNKKVSNVGGMIDVFPTLGNMFGLSNKYSLGHDLFSVKNNVVVFSDGNWVTDRMYYNSQKEEALLFDSDYPIGADYIEKNNLVAEERISVSNSIIIYDMIRSLDRQSKIMNSGG